MKIGKFLLISGSFWVICAHFRHSQKNPKISTNTYCTKLHLCELNSVDDTLEFEYKFGAWQILYQKTTFDLNIFPLHMEFGRKIKKTFSDDKNEMYKFS